MLTREVETLPIGPDNLGYGTLHLFPGMTSAYDPEPEYIAVDPSGKRAYVVLREANVSAALNLRTLALERIYSLGLKDLSLPGNEIDPSVRDGHLALRSVPVKGL